MNDQGELYVTSAQALRGIQIIELVFQSAEEKRGIARFSEPIGMFSHKSIPPRGIPRDINIDGGPVLGIAILAGVGRDIYSSIPKAADAIIKAVNVVEPNSEWSKIYAELYQIYKNLYVALKESL